MISKVVVFLIQLYSRFVSPILGPRCRFYPSCSQYTAQAFSEYSLVTALVLSLKRIFKCHPYHKGGFDPLPLLEANLKQCSKIS